MTQKFTAEEVRKISRNLDDLVAPITLEENIVLNRAAAALRAYAATLSKPADSGRAMEALRTIKYSIQQARILGNDWKRELALIENTVDAALAAQGQVAVAAGQQELLEDLERVIQAHAGMKAGDEGAPAMTIRVCRQAIKALAAQGQGEPVAEVYEFPRDFHEPTATMLTGIHFTGMPLPVGTKLYTHSAIDNAQAVDVGAIREVIAYLKVGHKFDKDMADKLTRAIGNVQADD